MIETSDLYKGAYLLSCGGYLKEMRQTKTRHIAFVIQGDLMKEDLLYKSGQAQVNPLDLRKFINFLRDQINERKHHEKGTRGRNQANQSKHRSSYRSHPTRH